MEEGGGALTAVEEGGHFMYEPRFEGKREVWKRRIEMEMELVGVILNVDFEAKFRTGMLALLYKVLLYTKNNYKL